MEIPCEAEKRPSKKIEAATMEIRATEMEIEMKKHGAPFKYGLVGPYLRKFAFEDREHVPTFEYYDNSDSDDDSDGDQFRHPNAHEVVKRFLRQVQESNGKNYEFVKVENAVFTRSSLFLLTFTVKDHCVDSSIETLRAMVSIPYDDKEEYALEEWMYKPLPATATGS
ncbi:Cystatin/monellin superfamily protein [Perilla frutescens var. hirtella]|nr:Cystatin/monellin superfamily protein [Perilla frutescens var. hirtella]